MNSKTTTNRIYASALALVVGYFGFGFVADHEQTTNRIQDRQVQVERTIADAEKASFEQNDLARQRYAEMMDGSASVQDALEVAAKACPLTDGDAST